MSDTNEDPTPPEDLPRTLIEGIDALERPALESLLSYVEQRIEMLPPGIEAEIEAEAAGEILEIETYGTDALVRVHPPDPDGPDVNTEITSLFHVRREPRLDGTESLHWGYLGDVHNTEETRCGTCGQTFDYDIDVCPTCGSEDVDHEETEE